MNHAGPNPYLRTKILTASPEELRLMLYDGAIKFCRQAIHALEEQQIENSYNCLMRAQKIVLELSTSLKHEVDPELCAKLSGLYTYIYKLLVEANLNHTTKPVDEALKLLEYEKETWQLLMKKILDAPAYDGGDGGRTDDTNVASAQQTAISSLSTNA